MPIDTVDDLIDALGDSELFTAEQFSVVLRELAGVNGDFQDHLRCLVDAKRLSVYQLRKVIHGKSADLLLGPYVISDKIGEGGMGRVYRARHRRLDREVALKVVRASLLNNPLVRKRYDREVETASALNHPNIVSVYDAGEIEGKVYLAMEFVDGIDLSRLVKEYRPLAIPEACEYVRQAALGLHYAHEQGLVHRDVKPSNVVVAGERHVPHATEPAIVKILDMGLVRNVGFDDGGGGGDLTRAGTVVGTPDYMAPEQAKNSSAVDARADLYSLGCTLYYLLSAQPPFSAGTAIEKLLKHQLDSPIPLQALRPEVPAEVAEIVARLLAKKPEDRIQSAATVAEALAPLARYVHGSPLPVVSRAPMAARSEALPHLDPSAVPPPSGPFSTIPPPFSTIPPPFSTIPPEPTEPAPIPLVEPVAPSDQTPRPRDLPPALHAAAENTASPFSTLSEPPSGPVEGIARGDSQKKPAPVRRTHLLLALPIALVLAVGIGLGVVIALGERGKSTESGGGTQESTNPGDSSSRTPVRPGIVPNINPSRLLPRTDLLVNDPGLVVIAYPAAYLREKDSPYVGGAGRTGPGKLVGWATRLAGQTALSLADSERIVLSFPAGSLDRYLLVSEGSYLTTSFANHLAANPQLRPLKLPAKVPASVKVYQASANRYTALVPAGPGSQVYAVASGPGLLNGLIAHLSSVEGPRPPPSIDPGMLAALNTPANPPPLIHAVIGPTFRFPFEFQSPDKEYLTPRDWGIDVIAARVSIHERMELELALVGKDEKSVDGFLTWLRQKIADEYPSDGSLLLSFFSKPDRASYVVNGKYRLTLKSTLTPDQWSQFLDRMLMP